jgi:hypothetical protein
MEQAGSLLTACGPSVGGGFCDNDIQAFNVGAEVEEFLGVAVSWSLVRRLLRIFTRCRAHPSRNRRTVWAFLLGN